MPKVNAWSGELQKNGASDSQGYHYDGELKGYLKGMGIMTDNPVSLDRTTATGVSSKTRVEVTPRNKHRR